MITRAALDRCVTAYLGDGASADDPLVSPVKADLAGLPPLFIQVGTDELFLSDSTTFADRAALAGIDVELHVWAEMVHAWPLFHLALPVSGAAAIAEASAWIARQLAR
jgi:acetyl esterase/lipase